MSPHNIEVTSKLVVTIGSINGVAIKARRPLAADECVPAAEALARAFRFLGKRWNAVVLGHLSAGPAGFRELSRAIEGISDSVLSDRLADLASGGLITRTVSEGPPLSVSYALTDRGRALMPALEQIANWARDNLPDSDGEPPAPAHTKHAGRGL
jgi:DNA-binding HxlR family transcriptional regulator